MPRAALRSSIAAFFFASSAALADFSGVVVRILDGDTVDILVDRSQVRVRLAEIDAPEKTQAFGSKARQTLSDAIFNQRVFVRSSNTDRYGRKLGTLFVEGENINKMMVSKGMAWAYRHYLSDTSILDAELRARSQRLGLWVDPDPVEPAQWRAVKRN